MKKKGCLTALNSASMMNSKKAEFIMSLVFRVWYEIM